LEIPGVNLANFVRAAHNSTKGVKQNSIQEVKDFRDKLKGEMKALGIREEFGLRSVNEGFSGGEKKRVEVLQLKMLSPKYAILDETDSGLDIDSLKTVSKAVDSVRGKTGLLVVTHYQRILRFVKPDFVHVMIEGKIALSGKGSLAAELEKKGYEWVKGKTRK
jgi:Fe-S cluster assembly ATP-binding protein